MNKASIYDIVTISYTRSTFRLVEEPYINSSMLLFKRWRLSPDLCPHVDQPRLIEAQHPDHGGIILEASLHQDTPDGAYATGD